MRLEADIKMNRLILIGNGFDLAHKLKTSYKDFLLWYLKSVYKIAFVEGKYEDDLVRIVFKGTSELHSAGMDTSDRYLDYCYKHGFANTLGFDVIPQGKPPLFTNPFNLHVKTVFFNNLLLNCTESNWVDIENEYYKELKRVQRDSNKLYDLRALNLGLKTLIEKLETYLLNIPTNSLESDYHSIFRSDILTRELVDNLSFRLKPTSTMILNFNYTSTVEKYVPQDVTKNEFEVNYIHGKLADQYNPLIFGFGDELDEDYKQLELDPTIGLFDYIKSFGYFKTSGYYKLIRFIESMPYQVFILGHSCGLSDRTMLNMIFENDNCKSIKIFYHGDQQNNNYTVLTSRDIKTL